MTVSKELYESFNYSPKLIPHMCYWLEYFFKYSKYHKKDIYDDSTLKGFIDLLGNKEEPWKVSQAEEAVKIYVMNPFFKGSHYVVPI